MSKGHIDDKGSILPCASSSTQFLLTMSETSASWVFMDLKNSSSDESTVDKARQCSNCPCSARPVGHVGLNLPAMLARHIHINLFIQQKEKISNKPTQHSCCIWLLYLRLYFQDNPQLWLLSLVYSFCRMLSGWMKSYLHFIQGQKTLSSVVLYLYP